MSVPEGKRNTTKLEVFTKAQNLAAHTAKVVSNTKIFNPEIDPILLTRIKNCAYNIYVKAWQANGIVATKSKTDRSLRYKLQRESVLECDALMTYIGISKQLFHLKTKKVLYWVSLVRDVRKLLTGWIDSDIERYGSP